MSPAAGRFTSATGEPLAASAVDWPSVSVLVAGLAVSGRAAARHLLAAGARVTVVDGRNGDAERRAADELEAAGGRAVLGAALQEALAGPPAATEAGLGALSAAGPPDLVVTSPGWRPDHPLMLAAAAAGVPVWGEVELAWRFGLDGATPWLAVTGTNGKTTTTQMLAAVLESAGLSGVAAGNIGLPLVDAVTADPPYDILAVELSSFQLHWSSSLRPLAGAVLNVAPDHLDWHGSAASYAADKARIWADPDCIAVGNADDPGSRALLHAAPGRHVTFGLTGADVTLEGRFILDRVFGGGRIVSLDDLRVDGAHNVANALAATALARADGVAPEAVADGLAAFRTGAHRNEVVARAGGVTFVDDSKATNPHAAAASLGAYPSVVWIAGGLNKGLAFDDAVLAARGRTRTAVLIGSCAEEVREALARHAPDIPVVTATDMDHAVREAARAARPGDTVLLAPAAASMDMFRDYAERGDSFAAAARRAADRQEPS